MFEMQLARFQELLRVLDQQGLRPPLDPRRQQRGAAAPARSAFRYGAPWHRALWA